jgi:hypothetical protein
VYLNGAAQGRTGGFELFGCRGDVSPLSWFTDGQKGTTNAGLSCGHVAFSAARIGPFLIFGDKFVWFSVGKMREKAKNDGFPEPEPSAHIRREAIGRFCHSSLLSFFRY